MLRLSLRRGAAQFYNSTVFFEANDSELWVGNCHTLPVANQSCGMNNIMNGPHCELHWPRELRDNNHHSCRGEEGWAAEPG